MKRNLVALLMYFLSFIPILPIYAASFNDYVTNPSTDNVYFTPSLNYIRLQSALLVYQNAANHDWQPLPEQNLRIGKTSSLVPMIRERLALLGDLLPADNTGSDLYDQALAHAVSHFQWRHGLKPTGKFDKATCYALNLSPQYRIKQIQDSMQRLVQMGNPVNQRYILVNIPEYQLHVYDQGKEQFSMKIIVGKPARPTPELASVVTRIVFNPYWNVPDSIAEKDIIPKILVDPHYLESANIKIFTQQDENAKEIDEEKINWHTVSQNGFNYHFRQEPGPTNALGLIKFEFQNPFDVYMHDTPAKELFNANNRAFSSGCIRLENPFALQQYLMQSDTTWNTLKTQETIAAGKTLYQKIKTPIPIFITYMTAWVDGKGITHFSDDIYHLN